MAYNVVFLSPNTCRITSSLTSSSPLAAFTSRFSKFLPKHLNQIHPPFSNYNSCRITMSAAPSSTTTATSAASDLHLPQSTSWLEFSKNVSGEWDGYGADFTTDGKPIELPERVVPDAYREWEVRVFDWQTQCPTLAQSHHFCLFYKLIKLLPTVGCEADAATRYTVDQMNIGGADNQVSAFAYHSTGTYVAVWPMEAGALDLEFCLVDPRNKESRVRVIQVVGNDGSNLVLKNIKVFREQWYGPFRNGEQLGGCAIRDSAFASTPALEASQLTGNWQANNTVARFQTSSNTDLIQELVDDDSMQNYARDGSDIVFLPKQLWCSLKKVENGETHCEVGWLLDQGQAIASRCIFSSDTNLKEIVVGSESAAALENL